MLDAYHTKCEHMHNLFPVWKIYKSGKHLCHSESVYNSEAAIYASSLKKSFRMDVFEIIQL